MQATARAYYNFIVLPTLSQCTHPVHCGDDVHCAVTHVAQGLHALVGLSQVSTAACRQHVLDQQRVRLVAHLEHRVCCDVAKACVGGLKQGVG